MKVYLAGPDVFRAGAVKYGWYLKDICTDYGIKGLWPMDNDVNLGRADAALLIRQANEHMIRIADAVIANIEPFRGPGMDPGTAYEIGFARALEVPVYLYSVNLTKYRPRLCESFLDSLDKKFPLIEDFGLTENLMINADEIVYHNFETALEAAYTALQQADGYP